MEQKKGLHESEDLQFVFNRIFNTTTDATFKAWTDADQVAIWWGPKDFTNPVCKLDVRPGGKIHIDMTGPDGVVYPMGGTFHEVDTEQLVFTSTAFKDEQGNSALEVLNTVTFAEVNGKTKLRLQTNVVKATPEAEEALTGMEDGWNQSLFKLQELLEKKPEDPNSESDQ